MSDNVIILGAGFSADAGIPLMGKFMETMWTLARTGRCNGQKIDESERQVLIDALEVRAELDGYHGRAALDVWNIEDVLSILSFNVLAGGKREKQLLRGMTNAIARVIEITCLVEHDGKLDHAPQSSAAAGNYKGFWRSLINWSQEKQTPIPPILTFNYDLVLERSLLRALVGKFYRNKKPFRHGGVQINYSTDACMAAKLKCKDARWGRESAPTEPGMILTEFGSPEESANADCLNFDILKLHGSVNFSPKRGAHPFAENPTKRLISSLNEPLILPPIFNKATDSVGKEVWSRALQALRNCKNLIVCGYSLPATDIYMQYFLKAALGPNQELNRLFVFDPALFRADRRAEGEALRERYAQNFSDPIQKRIEYQPLTVDGWQEGHGTMKHLTWVLQNSPDSILFS